MSRYVTDDGDKLPDPDIAEFVPWNEFYTTVDWKQGEHVSVFGRTGSGKTFMTTDLLNIRNGYIIAFGVKKEDESLDYLIKKEGFQRITSWPPKPEQEGQKRFILWPHIEKPDDIDACRPIFAEALDKIYSQGGWTIYLDEVRYMSQRLKLAQPLSDIWILGRSSHLTLVGCTQRPTWVPLEMLTQASHVFLFAVNGQDDLQRLKALDIRNKDLVVPIVSRLPQYHCLYINTVTGEMLVTKAEKR